jgi:hypothetical protein
MDDHIARMEVIRNAYKILVRNLKGRNYLEYLGVGGRMILHWVFEKLDERVDWMHLAQYSDQWATLVNMLVKFLDSKKGVGFS